MIETWVMKMSLNELDVWVVERSEQRWMECRLKRYANESTTLSAAGGKRIVGCDLVGRFRLVRCGEGGQIVCVDRRSCFALTLRPDHVFTLFRMAVDLLD